MLKYLQNVDRSKEIKWFQDNNAINTYAASNAARQSNRNRIQYIRVYGNTSAILSSGNDPICAVNAIIYTERHK